MEQSKPQTKQAKPAPGDALLTNALDIPKGDVLIRRIAGPNGIHYHLGHVQRSRVYCLSIEMASRIMRETPGEFEPVFQDHRMLIEAASKKAETRATDKK